MVGRRTVGPLWGRRGTTATHPMATGSAQLSLAVESIVRARSARHDCNVGVRVALYACDSLRPHFQSVQLHE